MKIKTIYDTNCFDFDKKVNKALEEGWRLTSRQLVPPTSNSHDYLYAELVMPDPILTPTAPWEAIRAIRAFCDGVSFEDCQSNKCPLHAWCDQLEHSEDPTDWDIPEEDPQT